MPIVNQEPSLVDMFNEIKIKVRRLEALQLGQNLPLGIVIAPASQTGNLTFANTEVAAGLTTTFTAAANRYYKITYYEPQIGTGSGTFAVPRIRTGSVSGTQLQFSVITNTVADNSNVVWVGTFSAGPVTIVPTLQGYTSTTNTANRASINPAQLIIEDIGST
jgi:hypothetical protein